MTDAKRTNNWRRRGAFYQIYPRSFADANGDGIGDIGGIRSRLGYIHELGVDGVWINPWYPSPFCDGGYDVADYCAIHPWFGDVDDARLLLQDAGARGLKVLVDLVPNHTSLEHPWFTAALRDGAGSASRARYHFAAGRGEGGHLPPSDWESAFGGSAWTRTADGAWYLHLFDESQPDLNWSDPQLRAAFHDIMRFWIDLGVSGFRIDAVQGLDKDVTYPNWRGRPGDHHIPPGTTHPYRDRPGNHDIVRGWRRILDSFPDRELLMVGETVVAPWPRLAAYLRPDEFHQVFNFEFLETPWDGERLARQIATSIDAAAAVGAAPTWVWSNHDIMRPATRFGLPAGTDPVAWLASGDRTALDVELGRRRARAAAMLAMALPGAYFFFQGEELGLPEVLDLPDAVIDDPIFRRSGGTARGRDGCRVPIPWEADGPSLGFGSGPGWLPQPAGWGAASAAEQSGRRESTLRLFRRCLRLRAHHLDHDEFAWLDVPGAIAFRRGDVVSITNFGDEAMPLPAGTPLAFSEPGRPERLGPDATAWVLIDGGCRGRDAGGACR